VADSLVWYGFTEQMTELYQAADVFALPSQNEGMPNAVLEAMASGLPVVATAISGIVDLVEDEATGRLVEPDAAPLTEALQTYLDRAALRDAHGQAARQKIESHYSTRVVLDQHEQLFRRIIAGCEPRG
jgi:glycosyltransferase involved in cell wall biosynthesis